MDRREFQARVAKVEADNDQLRRIEPTISMARTSSNVRSGGHNVLLDYRPEELPEDNPAMPRRRVVRVYTAADHMCFWINEDGMLAITDTTGMAVDPMEPGAVTPAKIQEVVDQFVNRIVESRGAEPG